MSGKTDILLEPLSKRLDALILPQADQAQMATLLPEIRDVAVDLGEFTFCFEKAQKYKKNESDEPGKKTFKFLYKLKLSARYGMWAILAMMAAALNTKAVETVVPSEWPKNVGLSVAFVASIGIVYVVDLLIASNIKFSLGRNDAESERQILLHYQGARSGNDNNNANSMVPQAANLTPGAILDAQIYGEKRALEYGQGKYFKKNSIFSFASLFFLALYFSVEFSAALYENIYTGGIDANSSMIDFISVAAPPLLGALFNVMTGILNGYSIAYPKGRQEVSSEYVQKYFTVDRNTLERQLQVMNFMTNIFLNNPSITSDEFRRIRDLKGFSNRFQSAYNEHESVVESLRKQRNEQLRNIRKQLVETSEAHAQDILKYSQEETEEKYFTEAKKITRHCKAKILEIKQELEGLGYDGEDFYTDIATCIEKLNLQEKEYSDNIRALEGEEKFKGFIAELTGIKHTFKTTCEKLRLDYEEQTSDAQVEFATANQQAKLQLIIENNQKKIKHLKELMATVNDSKQRTKQLEDNGIEDDLSSNAVQELYGFLKQKAQEYAEGIKLAKQEIGRCEAQLQGEQLGIKVGTMRQNFNARMAEIKQKLAHRITLAKQTYEAAKLRPQPKGIDIKRNYHLEYNAAVQEALGEQLKVIHDCQHQLEREFIHVDKTQRQEGVLGIFLKELEQSEVKIKEQLNKFDLSQQPKSTNLKGGGSANVKDSVSKDSGLHIVQNHQDETNVKPLNSNAASVMNSAVTHASSPPANSGFNNRTSSIKFSGRRNNSAS